MAATVALAFGLAADVYVVIAKMAQSPPLGIVAGTVSFLTLVGLWHVSPWYMRRLQTNAAR